MEVASFFEKASELESAGIPFVVVTLAGTRGHAPQDPGAKAIILKGGLEWGTVGGGKVEAKAILYSQEMLKLAAPAGEKPGPELLTWNLQRDVGMSCGGEVSFLFERFVGVNWTIVVFGAGHVAQILVRQLLMLRAKVICVDTRPEWLEKMPKDSKKLKSILTESLAESVADLPEDASYVVMTRGHATDLPVLEALLKRGTPPYVGAIGSHVKGIKIRKDLADLGILEERVKIVRCPMGIDIGNRNDPAEIGISIAAELIATRGRG